MIYSTYTHNNIYTYVYNIKYINDIIFNNIYELLINIRIYISRVTSN